MAKQKAKKHEPREEKEFLAYKAHMAEYLPRQFALCEKVEPRLVRLKAEYTEAQGADRERIVGEVSKLVGTARLRADQNAIEAAIVPDPARWSWTQFIEAWDERHAPGMPDFGLNVLYGAALDGVAVRQYLAGNSPEPA